MEENNLCNLSSIIRHALCTNDRKLHSIHTESALGQLSPIQMDGRIQKGRRFLGVARGFDQKLELPLQTYHFVKLKKSC